MNRDPVEVVQRLIGNITDPAVVRELVSPEAVYVSTFNRIFFHWSVYSLEVTDIFGQGEHVAAFGRFTYPSSRPGKVATSPFSIHARVVDGKVIYFQCLEDDHATASTFRVRGSWYVRSEPEEGIPRSSRPSDNARLNPVKEGACP